MSVHGGARDMSQLQPPSLKTAPWVLKHLDSCTTFFSIVKYKRPRSPVFFYSSAFFPLPPSSSLRLPTPVCPRSPESPECMTVRICSVRMPIHTSSIACSLLFISSRFDLPTAPYLPPQKPPASPAANHLANTPQLFPIPVIRHYG